jgi:hypothetical protein
MNAMRIQLSETAAALEEIERRTSLSAGGAVRLKQALINDIMASDEPAAAARFQRKLLIPDVYQAAGSAAARREMARIAAAQQTAVNLKTARLMLAELGLEHDAPAMLKLVADALVWASDHFEIPADSVVLSKLKVDGAPSSLQIEVSDARGLFTHRRHKLQALGTPGGSLVSEIAPKGRARPDVW